MNKKNLIFGTIFITLCASIFYLSFFKIDLSFAQDVSQMQNEISERNEQIKQLQAEIDAYNNKVAGTQEEAKTLKAAINKLESQKRDLQNQIALTNLKIQNTEGDIVVTSNKISENQSVIAQERKAIANTLVEMKKNEDSNNFILNLIKNGNSNFSEFLDTAYKLMNFSGILNKKIQEITGSIDNLNANKSEYEKQKEELASLSKDLNSKQGIVVQNQNEQNDLLADTKNEEKEYQKIIADRQSKVDALQDEINDFEAKIKYTLNPSTLPSTGDGLAWPLAKFVITQYFGDTEFAATGAYNGHGHSGIDLGTAVGTKVMAASDGVVMGTGNTDAACKKASYGKWILIKHNNGLATLYGHLSAIDVKAGQKVSVGEQIGLSGNTGYSTGPHLHFTVFAADAVKIFGPTEYKSKVCGTYMVMPYAPLNAYLNPLTYLPKQ